MQWFFERGSGQEGPVETEALRAMLADGSLKAENKVWRKGLPDWLPAGDVEDLASPAPAPVAAPTPPPAAPAAAAPEPVAVDKPASASPVYVPPAAGHQQSTGAGESSGTAAGVCKNPVEAFKRVVLENYMNLSGRAPRSEFWWFQLAWYIVLVIASMINDSLAGLLMFALFIPSLAVSVRRMHDIGKSGFYMFAVMVPVIGPFVLLYWFVQDSESGSNAYGPNPKG